MRATMRSAHPLVLAILISMVVLIGGVLIPSAATAATYYVSASGSDGNSCATAQTCGSSSCTTAKRNIHGANGGLACIGVGDTLYIRTGTYNDYIDPLADRFPPSGTSYTDAPHIAAYPGETVILRPSSIPFSYGLGIPPGAHHVIFDGFILDGSLINGSPCGSTIFGVSISDPGNLSNPPHHIRFKNMEVGNWFGGGFLVSLADSIEWLGLKVHDNGRDTCYRPGANGYYMAAPTNSIIDGGEIYNNLTGGVRIFNSDYPPAPRATNNIVRNALVHDNGGAIAQISSGGIILGDIGNMAYNNIVYNNGASNPNGGYGIAIGYGTPSNIQVYYNTVYNHVWGNIDVGTSVPPTNTIVRNNISTSGTINLNSGTGTVLSNNLCSASGTGCAIVGDPKFVSPATNNFHLQSGSPAIDAGVAVSQVTTDFDGISRPQGPGCDIGAYEFHQASQLPPPANLHIVSP